jgi:hypothetical protein
MDPCLSSPCKERQVCKSFVEERKFECIDELTPDQIERRKVLSNLNRIVGRQPLASTCKFYDFFMLIRKKMSNNKNKNSNSKK